MKIGQTKAHNVLERTSDYIRSGLLTKTPVWYNVIAAHPPLKDLTIKQIRKTSDFEKSKNVGMNAFYKTRFSSQNKVKASLFKPGKLKFVEDELRDLFYHQHPWEFARPKVIMENTGNDAAKQNWSHMRQLNTPLEGESVVQRTLWLAKNGKKEDGSKYEMIEAYDKARFEFYRLRMEDDLEVQLLKEESEMSCAIFGQSPIDFGFEKEQAVIEKWRNDAIEQTKIIRANSAGPQTAYLDPTETEAETQGEGSENNVEK